MPLKLAVVGGLGRMGREIVELAAARASEFTVSTVVAADGSPEVGKRVQDVLPVKGEARVVSAKSFKDTLLARARRAPPEGLVMIEVAGPDAGGAFVVDAIRAGVRFVSGSTGYTPKELDIFARDAKRMKVPGVWTPNFSVGVNVWWAAVAQVAKLLPEYDAEIVEVHHNQKKDAPSGTAKRAAELIQRATGVERLVHGREGKSAQRGREIGIHAVRMGDVVGDHTAYFSGNAERLEVSHRAHSRRAFAAGALTAAQWVAKSRKGGLHTMAEVLGLTFD